MERDGMGRDGAGGTGIKRLHPRASGLCVRLVAEPGFEPAASAGRGGEGRGGAGAAVTRPPRVTWSPCVTCRGRRRAPEVSQGSGGGGAEGPGGQQALARPRGARAATPFVFTRRGSMYYDEDGDLAHEFYEETIVTKNGRKRAKLKRIHKNLIPQGIVKLEHPRIHVDFPVIICEV
uniref:Tumor suppressor 2, mitochondrial calcium regulator n=1 Tax=Anas zonorhyncha TaxID=75864 RepID=A0A8B9VWH4_9AVES